VWLVCVVCNAPAGILCDFPVGRTTCDKPLCHNCAQPIGPNVDFCPSHPLPATELSLELPFSF
jgi:hypothetical protein